MAKQFLRTDNTKKRIDRITFKKEVDESPDLSFLGEYSNKPGDPAKTIDRQERGDMGRNEFRYFVAAMSGKDTGNPESVEQDYQRMEGCCKGEWCMLFLVCEARIVINGIIQTVTSGGLGGVESDCDDDLFDEIKQVQKEELAAVLRSIGFSQKQISAAFKKMEEE